LKKSASRRAVGALFWRGTVFTILTGRGTLERRRVKQFRGFHISSPLHTLLLSSQLPPPLPPTPSPTGTVQSKCPI